MSMGTCNGTCNRKRMTVDSLCDSTGSACWVNATAGIENALAAAFAAAAGLSPAPLPRLPLLPAVVALVPMAADASAAARVSCSCCRRRCARASALVCTASSTKKREALLQRK